MAKRVAIGSILCLVVLVPSATGHSHHRKAKTGVRLEAYEPNTFPGTHNGEFIGTVLSKKASCRNDRTLRPVLRRPGKDQGLNEGHSGNGRPAPFDIAGNTERTGHYYVLAPETKQCKAGRSNELRITAN